MKFKKGFTFIEVLIVISIVGIIAAIAVPVIMGAEPDSTMSVGYNGVTEVRCISGYKFVVADRGHTTQILDSQGHGVSCF